MSRILAIDPGPTQSGWVILEDGKVVQAGVDRNDDLRLWVKHGQRCDLLAVEMFEARGMPIGRESIETILWAGRFMECWPHPQPVLLVYRSKVKLALCGSAKAKDANIRQALIDRLGAPGTKREPGNTYGVKSHAWAALGVAVTAQEMAA